LPEGDEVETTGVPQLMILKQAGALLAIAGQTMNNKCRMIIPGFIS
jgi:hypothetical protein